MVGRHKILPTDIDELKKYKKEHYYPNIKKYEDNKRKEKKTNKLKKLFNLIKDSYSFDDIKDFMMQNIKIKDFL